MIPSVTLLTFSATGTTRRVVSLLGNCLSDKVAQVNLLQKKRERHQFDADDFLVVGVPVYGGRVPDLALQALCQFSGQGTPAVSVVVYGNRAYDDALLELNDTLRENGFRIMASGAFVGQHSIANSIAAGRPDQIDRDEIESFAEQIGIRYASIGQKDWEEPVVPGQRPYKEYMLATVAPSITGDCIKCKACVQECPVEAVSLESTDSGKCILCMRCVSICPQKARTLPGEYLDRILQYLQAKCPGRSQNETFI